MLRWTNIEMRIIGTIQRRLQNVRKKSYPYGIYTVPLGFVQYCEAVTYVSAKPGLNQGFDPKNGPRITRSWADHARTSVVTRVEKSP